VYTDTSASTGASCIAQRSPSKELANLLTFQRVPTGPPAPAPPRRPPSDLRQGFGLVLVRPAAYHRTVSIPAIDINKLAPEERLALIGDLLL